LRQKSIPGNTMAQLPGKVFAEEEAIETAVFSLVPFVRLHAGKVFAEEEAIETWIISRVPSSVSTSWESIR